MMTSGRGLTALVACLAALIGCSSTGPSSSVDVGSDCFSANADAGTAATDCGSLKCFCASDSFPGVCSQACSKQADCDALGGGMSCAQDFCTGVNICLQTFPEP